jgi:hypothetical protein
MIEYLPLVLTGIGIMASILYYTSVLRNANKTQQMQLETRQAQLYNNIWNQSLNNPDWQRNYLIVSGLQFHTLEEYLEQVPYNDYDSVNTLAIWGVSTFFEGLSPLIKMELIDLRVFYPTLYNLLKSFWMKILPILDDAREQLSPTIWTESEYVYNTLTAYLEEHPELAT